MITPASLIHRLFAVRWLASICLLLLLDVATWLALKPVGKGAFEHQDKIMHVIGFFGLTCAGHVALHFDWFRGVRRFRASLYLLNGLIWVGYGVFTEAAQSLVPYRSSSSVDLVADCIGVALGLIFVSTLKIYPKGEPPSNGAR